MVTLTPLVQGDQQRSREQPGLPLLPSSTGEPLAPSGVNSEDPRLLSPPGCNEATPPLLLAEQYHRKAAKIEIKSGVS